MKKIIVVQWTTGPGVGEGAQCQTLVEDVVAARVWVCAHALRNGWPTTRFTLTEYAVVDRASADESMFNAQSEIGIN